MDARPLYLAAGSLQVIYQHPTLPSLRIGYNFHGLSCCDAENQSKEAELTAARNVAFRRQEMA